MKNLGSVCIVFAVMLFASGPVIVPNMKNWIGVLVWLAVVGLFTVFALKLWAKKEE